MCHEPFAGTRGSACRTLGRSLGSYRSRRGPNRLRETIPVLSSIILSWLLFFVSRLQYYQSLGVNVYYFICLFFVDEVRNRECEKQAYHFSRSVGLLILLSNEIPYINPLLEFNLKNSSPKAIGARKAHFPRYPTRI